MCSSSNFRAFIKKRPTLTKNCDNILLVSILVCDRIGLIHLPVTINKVLIMVFPLWKVYQELPTIFRTFLHKLWLPFVKISSYLYCLFTLERKFNRLSSLKTSIGF